MTPVEFHPEAEEEARQAAAHYENVQTGLGADFKGELDAALSRLRDNPLLYAAESGAIRVCPIHRFSFCIFYSVLTDRIWVAAVGHNRRRSSYWARRRPS